MSPAAASGLNAAGGTGSAALSWTNNATNPAATDFLVQRATDSGFTANVTEFTVTGPATVYTDTGVAPGTYYYRVRAENAISYSLWTDPASAIVN